MREELLWQRSKRFNPSREVVSKPKSISLPISSTSVMKAPTAGSRKHKIQRKAEEDYTVCSLSQPTAAIAQLSLLCVSRDCWSESASATSPYSCIQGLTLMNRKDAIQPVDTAVRIHPHAQCGSTHAQSPFSSLAIDVRSLQSILADDSSLTNRYEDDSDHLTGGIPKVSTLDACTLYSS